MVRGERLLFRHQCDEGFPVVDCPSRIPGGKGALPGITVQRDPLAGKVGIFPGYCQSVFKERQRLGKTLFIKGKHTPFAVVGKQFLAECGCFDRIRAPVAEQQPGRNGSAARRRSRLVPVGSGETRQAVPGGSGQQP